MRTTSSSGSFRLTSLSFSRWLPLTWRNHRRQEILLLAWLCREGSVNKSWYRILALPTDPWVSSSTNLLASCIEETSDSSKCFVELGLDLVFLLQSESSQFCHEFLESNKLFTLEILPQNESKTDETRIFFEKEKNVWCRYPDLFHKWPPSRRARRFEETILQEKKTRRGWEHQEDQTPSSRLSRTPRSQHPN